MIVTKMGRGLPDQASGDTSITSTLVLLQGGPVPIAKQPELGLVLSLFFGHGREAQASAVDRNKVGTGFYKIRPCAGRSYTYVATVHMHDVPCCFLKSTRMHGFVPCTHWRCPVPVLPGIRYLLR
jgi:hypothetical protein